MTQSGSVKGLASHKSPSQILPMFCRLNMLAFLFGFASRKSVFAYKLLLLLDGTTFPFDPSRVDLPINTPRRSVPAFRHVLVSEAPGTTMRPCVAYDRGLCRRGRPCDSDLSAIFRVRRDCSEVEVWDWGRSRHDRGRGLLGFPSLRDPARDLLTRWPLDCVPPAKRVSDFLDT